MPMVDNIAIAIDLKPAIILPIKDADGGYKDPGGLVDKFHRLPNVHLEWNHYKTSTVEDPPKNETIRSISETFEAADLFNIMGKKIHDQVHIGRLGSLGWDE